MVFSRSFFSVIVEMLLLEHKDDRLKEQKCQVLFLVALGEIMDFSTTIMCNFLLHKCKIDVGGGKPPLDVQHLMETSGFQFTTNPHHSFLRLLACFT